MLHKLLVISLFIFLFNGHATMRAVAEIKGLPAYFPMESVRNVSAGDDSTPVKIGDEHPVVSMTKTITKTTRADSIVAFAKTLLGIPYRYASTDPRKGFDCSGLITYVFNHFNIKVPRSSVDFTHYGKEITLKETKPGDLILFTGTDRTIRVVGHMGIVENVQEGTLRFIHASSGKAYQVMISPLGDYYQGRFVKLIRILPEEMYR